MLPSDSAERIVVHCMKLTQLTPMLRTWNLDSSIKFYTNTLGFECTSLNHELGWACLVKDEIEIMLASPNRHEGDAASKFTGSLYFRTDDVDGLWDALRDKVEVCYALETFSYGMREFGVYDNNGYLLQFGQPV